MGRRTLRPLIPFHWFNLLGVGYVDDLQNRDGLRRLGDILVNEAVHCLCVVSHGGCSLVGGVADRGVKHCGEPVESR